MPSCTNFSGCSMGSSTTSRILSICRPNNYYKPAACDTFYRKQCLTAMQPRNNYR